MKPDQATTAPLSGHEARRLLEELKIHQVELEMQNEELRLAQAALESLQARYADLYDFAPAGYLTVDEMGIILEANLKAASLLGVVRGELVRQSIIRYIVPEDLPLYRQHHAMATTADETLTCELRLLPTDRPLFWARMDSIRAQEKDGPVTYRCILRDITKRKNDDEVLRESEERFRLAILHAPIPVMIHADDGTVIQISRSWTEITGYRLADIPTIGDWTLKAYGRRQQSIVEKIQQLYSTNSKVDEGYFTITTSTGETRIWDFSSAPLGQRADGRKLVISMAKDVTERLRAEENLIHSEQKFKVITESSPLAIYMSTGVEQVADYINPTFIRLFGYTLEEVPTVSHWWPLAYPDEGYRHQVAAEWNRRVEHAIKNHSEIEPIETIVTCKDGSKKSISWGYVSKGSQCWAFGLDISGRKQAEAEKERMMAAIEQGGETVIITDTEGIVQYVNQAFEQVTGYTREEVIGQTTRIFKSGRHDEAFYRQLWSTITAGETFTGRIVNKRKDGSFYTEDATISPVCNLEGKIVNYVAVKRDVTAHIQLQEQFTQAQKMESVGRLAGGIAHDFNNMLSVILGFSELALSKVGPSDPLHEDLQEIYNAGKRSAGIIRQLLAFARRQAIAPMVLDLNEIVESTLKMLRRLIGEDITLNWLPGAKLKQVKIDPSQLDQLLANICVNARDAIEGVGKVTIETGMATIDEDYCARHSDFIPGDFVFLAVGDNGIGMDKETADKIFEPFFTTKEEGQGTGLGLAMVYGIVKQNNGFIDVCSEPGKGTTFKIYLPFHEGADERREDTIPEEKRSGHGETILVVEDEEEVLKLIRIILATLGLHRPDRRHAF